MTAEKISRQYVNIEKVNPTHPDKVADRIAGAIVDLAYQKAENPKIAVEVLIGHKKALKAQQTGEVVNISCAIGDEMVDGLPYSEIVEIARKYIEGVGGFEKFAEWGLV